MPEYTVRANINTGVRLTVNAPNAAAAVARFKEGLDSDHPGRRFVIFTPDEPTDILCTNEETQEEEEYF